MDTEKRSVGRHWSKDFVEHLRSIHFALLAVCVGVVVLASTRSQSEVSRAHEQIKQILDARQHWDENFLEHAALKPEDSQDVISSAHLTIEAPNGRKSANITLESPQAFVVLNKKVEENGKGEKARRVPFSSHLNTVLPKPTSVSEFKEEWDALDSGATVKTVKGYPDRCLAVKWNAEEQNDNFQELSCHWNSLSRSSKEGIARYRLMRGLPGKLAESSIRPFDYYFRPRVDAFGPSLWVIFPVGSFSEHPFDAESEFLGRYPKLNWHTGPFDRTFRELANVAQAYLTIDLDTAERIIDAEERRTGESLDAFGLKFPAETAIRWGAGAMIILVVQLYLWAHLFEFRRKLGPSDEGWDVAWVGVYETRPARWMLYGSLLVFPLAGVAAVGVRGLYISDFRWYSWLVLLTTAVLTLSLSIAICRALPRRIDLLEDKAAG